MFPLTSPRALLRTEGAAVLLLSALAYGQIPGSWIAFMALLLVPDLAALGYLRGSRLGAATYNLAHTYLWPAALVGYWALVGDALVLGIGLVWAAHIGMDRMLGFGLKYPTAFRDTHLHRV